MSANPRPLRRTEWQCTTCGRVFASDPLCEAHKTYESSGVVCTNPADLGLESFERAGLEVWARPGYVESHAGRSQSLLHGQRTPILPIQGQ